MRARQANIGEIAIFGLMIRDTNKLLITCSALWLAAGVNVVRMGILALKESDMRTDIMVSGIIVVFILFAIMFCKISIKNMRRIQSIPNEKRRIWNCMPLKSFIIMAGMITLGVCLRRSEAIPRGCIASFYIGLGTALTMAGLLYLRSLVECKHGCGVSFFLPSGESVDGEDSDALYKSAPCIRGKNRP